MSKKTIFIITSIFTLCLLIIFALFFLKDSTLAKQLSEAITGKSSSSSIDGSTSDDNNETSSHQTLEKVKGTYKYTQNDTKQHEGYSSFIVRNITVVIAEDSSVSIDYYSNAGSTSTERNETKVQGKFTAKFNSGINSFSIRGALDDKSYVNNALHMNIPNIEGEFIGKFENGELKLNVNTYNTAGRNPDKPTTSAEYILKKE